MRLDRKTAGTPLARSRLRPGRLLRAGGGARSDLRKLVWPACAAALIVAGLAIWVMGSDSVRPADPSRPATRPAANPPVTQQSRGDAGGGERLLLDPPYDSLDGLTILQGSYRIRLAGIDGPSRNAICAAEDGRLWACGLQARAALHNVIAQNPLVCTPTGAVRAEVTVADCSAEGEDVARKLVEAGWARPEPSTESVFAPERDLARAEKRGLWDGGWSIRGGL